MIDEEESNIEINQIKLSNCFLSEILAEKGAVQLIHVNNKGVVTVMNRFNLIENKSDYILDTRCTL
jgi:hypothetical protein